MKKLVINIEEDKLNFFLELVREFSFISVDDSGDWYDNLSSSTKKSIDKGLEDFETGNSYTNDEVSHQVSEKLSKYRSQ